MAIYPVLVLAIAAQMGLGGSRVVVALTALELGASQFMVGTIIALYSVSPLFLSIVIGRISDRVPPHLPIMIGAALMAVALLAPALLPHIAALCFAALLLGLGALVLDIPLEASVGGVDGAEHRSRNYALITMSWSAANFCGPLMAGFCIDAFGHRFAFSALAACMIVPIAILSVRPHLFPQTAKGNVESTRGHVMDLLRVRALRATFIAGGIIGSAQNLFQFYMPVYGHAIELSASAIGTILGMVALAAFVIRALMPFIVKRAKETSILTAAIFVAALAYFLLPFFSDPVVLAAIAFLLGLGVGCGQPMIMSLLYVLSPKGRVAEAIGIYKTLRGTTHVLIPMLFGSVGSAFGFVGVFLSNALVLLAGGTIQAHSRKQDKRAKAR
jgi:MFS family permease